MSQPMKPSDPAYWMLFDSFTTTPVVYRKGCYICEDPEFAQMGMTLCYPCPKCGWWCTKDDIKKLLPQLEGEDRIRLMTSIGHIAADDTVCDDCGYEIGPEDYAPAQER